jgi:hypothetical protein
MWHKDFSDMGPPLSRVLDFKTDCTENKLFIESDERNNSKRHMGVIIDYCCMKMRKSTVELKLYGLNVLNLNID